ncbi:MAG: InlB B-repeat-containing protein [Thermoplasmata archaeon]
MTYTLTLQVGGLPAGLAWNATVGSEGLSSGATLATLPGLNGTYRVSFATVYGTSGARYADFPGTQTLSVLSNRTVYANYTTQYFATILAGGGGSTSTASGWYNTSQTLSLVETPAAGYHFVEWNGTGPGSYSGLSGSASASSNGPITETAVFAPNATPSSSGGSGTTTTDLAIGVVALIVLLVVGLLLGLVLSRRRGPPPAGGRSEHTVESEEASPPATEGSVPEEDGSEGTDGDPPTTP